MSPTLLYQIWLDRESYKAEEWFNFSQRQQRGAESIKAEDQHHWKDRLRRGDLLRESQETEGGGE